MPRYYLVIVFLIALFFLHTNYAAVGKSIYDKIVYIEHGGSGRGQLFAAFCNMLLGYNPLQVSIFVYKNGVPRPICTVTLLHGYHITGIDVYNKSLYLGVVDPRVQSFATLVIDPQACRVMRVLHNVTAVIDWSVDRRCSSLHLLASNGTFYEKSGTSIRTIAKIQIARIKDSLRFTPYLVYYTGRLLVLGDYFYTGQTNVVFGHGSFDQRLVGNVTITVGNVKLHNPSWTPLGWLGVVDGELVLATGSDVIHTGIRVGSEYFVRYAGRGWLVIYAKPDIKSKFYIIHVDGGKARVVLEGRNADAIIGEGYAIVALPSQWMAGRIVYWTSSGSKGSVIYAFLLGTITTPRFTAFFIVNLTKDNKKYVYKLVEIRGTGVNIYTLASGLDLLPRGLRVGVGVCKDGIAVWMFSAKSIGSSPALFHSIFLFDWEGRWRQLVAHGHIVGVDNECRPVYAGGRTIYTSQGIVVLPFAPDYIEGVASVHGTLYLSMRYQGDYYIAVVQHGKLKRIYLSALPRWYIVYNDTIVAYSAILTVRGAAWIGNAPFMYRTSYCNGDYTIVGDHNGTGYILVATPRHWLIARLPTPLHEMMYGVSRGETVYAEYVSLHYIPVFGNPTLVAVYHSTPIWELNNISIALAPPIGEQVDIHVTTSSTTSSTLSATSTVIVTPSVTTVKGVSTNTETRSSKASSTMQGWSSSESTALSQRRVPVKKTSVTSVSSTGKSTPSTSTMVYILAAIIAVIALAFFAYKRR